MAAIPMGASHGIGHMLGGGLGMAHGDTSAMLPAVPFVLPVATCSPPITETASGTSCSRSVRRRAVTMTCWCRRPGAAIRRNLLGRGELDGRAVSLPDWAKAGLAAKAGSGSPGQE